MKNFSRRGYRISDSSTENKLVYSFFLIFMLCGLATLAAFQFKIIGMSLEAIRQHYLGNETAMQFPKSFLSLLTTSHSHAFMMGIIYLTLAHIVLATGLKAITKRYLVSLGFIFILMDLILPWLIRYGNQQWAFAFPVAWIGQWAVYLCYIFIPLYEMWLKAPEPEED